MRVKLTLLLVAATLVLAACGSEDGSTGAGATPSSDPESPVVSSPMPDPAKPPGSGGGAQRVVPTPGMVDLHVISFDKVVVGDNRHDLLVFFWSGVEPCYVLDHVDVAYDTKTVTVTLYEGHEPAEEDVACIELAVYKVVRVALDEPLGDRKVEDGASKRNYNPNRDY